MPNNFPDILTRLPLRVSFLPMSGCEHFCSFCADNAGKRARPYSFDMIRSSVKRMNLRPESVALYNSCDGLTYRWDGSGGMHTVNHLVQLFLSSGTRSILLSSPGISGNSFNRRILDGLCEVKGLGMMLSFNREHLRDRKKLDNFLFTAQTLSSRMRCQVRIVYSSPEERAKLFELLEKNNLSGGYTGYRADEGVTLDAVPAAPLGRGRSLYFGKEGDAGISSRKATEEYILKMYRDEPCLKDCRFITEGGYETFLKQAAVQFAGFFIFLLRPTPGGMDMSLKVTDLKKTVLTRGLSHSTLYRFNADSGSFEHRASSGEVKKLKLLIFESRKCTSRDFSRFMKNHHPEIAGGPASKDIYCVPRIGLHERQIQPV